MGPKKNKITASTPAVANPSGTFVGISDTSGPSTINESSFIIASVEDVILKQAAVEKVSTLDLICKAIETVGVPRKGASYIAIQKWIVNNKENVEINRLRANMKKAVVKALESGLLKRPATSKNATGLKGYFILNKQVNHPKNTAATTAKALTAKTKSSKITKPKAVTAPKDKATVKPKSDTEEATSAKPKTKPVKSKSDAVSESSDKAKPKAKVAVKSKPGKADGPKAKSKTKATAGKSISDSEEGPKAKSKTKATAGKSISDSEEGPKAKSKTKATAGKSIPDSEDLLIPKPKVIKSRVNGVKIPAQEEEFDSEQVPKKVLKKVPPKSAKDNVKEPRSRKLYSSRINPVTNMTRKDLSDTELNVKPDNRKSLKSYSSDTEVDVTKKKAAKVAKNNKAKVAGTKKLNKKESSEAGPSNSKGKKQ